MSNTFFQGGENFSRGGFYPPAPPWLRTWFSVMIQKQFFCVFQLVTPEIKYFYQENTWKNPHIIFLSENDLKHETTLAKNLLRKESKLPISPEQVFFIYSWLQSCVWLLLVAATLPVTSASCERSFSKMKLVKTFPRNSMTSERLGNIDLRARFASRLYKLKPRSSRSKRASNKLW